ncbi:DNA-directed RNA polymerases III 12.5 kDa polypeptide [Uncinocarpus reesii 1704]|uniref:DNA-directed RNA polymerases III 12.5 kDa polypeptide n=1 Tax=Uncinocarpus reesii (strain UAMH 1704) TaxID=336963 RepID=C4JZF5_UNCRE|nr:DNA-directed RNA polymerases III 12.5 kDa polypeptide [Uncinocarpus reesii 1704]EEP82691.1 DNA-directed RNA polymerases III 12.5 kDa polypeptide [Uncinocarpus reesii 1704]
MPLTFCPNCSNALTISRGPSTSQYPLGVNRFECRTCPYQYILDRTYFERTEMKRKEVADVMGGKDEWKNADNMRVHYLRGSLERKLISDFEPKSKPQPIFTYDCSRINHALAKFRT